MRYSEISSEEIILTRKSSLLDRIKRNWVGVFQTKQ